MRLVDSFYVGHTTVEVALSDITAANVEVVVNSICDRLHFGSGVSGAFTRVGGPEIQAATIRAADGRNVFPGDVIVTGSSALPYRHIFHAISSKCRAGTTADILRRCAVNCLAEARSRNVRSIALPALGTGEMGFDIKEAAAVLIDAIVSDCASTPGLDRVVFCLLRPDAFTTFFRQAVRRSIALETESTAGSEPDQSPGPEDELGSDALVLRLQRETSAVLRVRLLTEAVSRLLVPPLSTPLANATKDQSLAYHEVVYPNYASDGVWRLLDERFGASIIRIVFANGDKPDIDAAVEHMCERLRGSGRGQVGLVIVPDRGARELSKIALDAHRNDGLLILTLDYLDLSQMLKLQRAGKRVETYLEAKVSALTVTSTECDVLAPKKAEPTARKIFVSYAHEDAAHQRRLRKSLKLMHIQGLIELWADCQILPGSAWKDQIYSKLNEAGIIVCLVSTDFIASEFCFSGELTRALELHKDRAAVVVPVIVRPCEWDQTPLASLQAMPVDSNGNLVAVTQWDDADTAWLQVSKGFRRLLSETAD